MCTISIQIVIWIGSVNFILSLSLPLLLLHLVFEFYIQPDQKKKNFYCKMDEKALKMDE